MIAAKDSGNWAAAPLAAKNLYQLFEFQPHLMDELLALIEVHPRIIARQPVSGSAIGEALFIQQATNLPNDQHVLPLVVAAVAAPLDRFELGKFLLPIAQHVGFDAA